FTASRVASCTIVPIRMIASRSSFKCESNSCLIIVIPPYPNHLSQLSEFILSNDSNHLSQLSEFILSNDSNHLSQLSEFILSNDSNHLIQLSESPYPMIR